MSEDLFKPLYKRHKRIGLENVTGAFDPRCSESIVRIGDYSMQQTNKKWTSDSLPGLAILTDVLSIPQQTQMIKESLVDFLQSPEHLTNLDAHYSLSRPLNLFDKESSSKLHTEKATYLTRDKIRWVTLGGQYNWTTKEYPSFQPGTPGCPLFPESLTKEVSRKFSINPEAAIVNYYSEGDILSPHQDVAELASQDLISISLGCTCIFYIGTERYGVEPLPIILRSGDIVVMGGDSRFAFHGVGHVFSASTPAELCESHEINDMDFHDWMMNHRININVRQMR